MLRSSRVSRTDSILGFCKCSKLWSKETFRHCFHAISVIPAATAKTKYG